MKNLCEACEAAIVAGSLQADPVLAKHWAECPECRDFAEFETLVRHAEPVLPEHTPELTEILAEKARREAAKRSRVRLLYLPLSLAAAAALAVAGWFFTLPEEKALPPGGVNVSVDAAPAVSSGVIANAATEVTVSKVGWISGEALTEDWSNQSLALAWDAASECENNCSASLALLRQDGNAWSIEAFNPIEEDWEI